jgi:hypothetical protein
VLEIPEAVAVADNYGLSNKYLALLRKHHATLYLPEPLAENKAAKFLIGKDIEGRLMPMSLPPKLTRCC